MMPGKARVFDLVSMPPRSPPLDKVIKCHHCVDARKFVKVTVLGTSRTAWGEDRFYRDGEKMPFYRRGPDVFEENAVIRVQLRAEESFQEVHNIVHRRWQLERMEYELFVNGKSLWFKSNDLLSYHLEDRLRLGEADEDGIEIVLNLHPGVREGTFRGYVSEMPSRGDALPHADDHDTADKEASWRYHAFYIQSDVGSSELTVVRFSDSDTPDDIIERLWPAAQRVAKEGHPDRFYDMKLLLYNKGYIALHRGDRSFYLAEELRQRVAAGRINTHPNTLSYSVSASDYGRTIRPGDEFRLI